MNRLYSLFILFLFAAFTDLSAQAVILSAEIHDPEGKVYRGEFKSASDDNGHPFYDFLPYQGMGLFWDDTNWTISIDDYPNVHFQATTNKDTPVPPSLAEGKWRTLKAGWKLVSLSKVGAPLGITLREFSPVSCNGAADASVQAGAIGGTGSYTYSWSDGTTTAATTNQLDLLENLAPGSYSVTITDGKNTVDRQIEIEEPEVLNASLIGQTNPACSGASTGTATVSASGGTMGYTYAWSNGATTATATGLAAGAHTVTVTDARGCTATVPVTLTEPAPLTLSAGVDAAVGCFAGTDGAATATAGGGTAPYLYAWSNGAATAALAGLPAGTYEVTVTDAGGCSASASVVITEPAVLTASVNPDAMASCYGEANGRASAAVNGGTSPYTYAWSNGATTPEIAGVAAGEYVVTVTDAGGCTATGTTTITEPQPIVATATAEAHVSCYGAASGAVTTATSGGTAPYTYAWSNGATTPDLADLAAGEYALTVTDEDGCTTTASVTITENSPLSVTRMASEDSGLGDGSLTAVVSGGIAPYTYAWSTEPVQTTATSDGLSAGEYTVLVTDAAGCTTDTTFAVRLALAGDNCGNARYVDSLLGGAIGTVSATLPTDNGRYVGALAGAGNWGDCFSEGDSLYHPVYYRFTGDGNTYHLRTAAGSSTNPLADGDTRGVLFSGTCGALTYVNCNDSESDDAANMWMEVSTEEGMEYTLMIDGASAASGEYVLEFSQVVSTAVTPIQQTAIAVYPNPTSGRVSITGVSAQQVDVYDGYGRRVSTQVRPGTEVDLQQLPAGVYYLRITNERQEVYSARVMKR